jgi:membrane protease YdiL (CAAX protease family)
VEISKEPTTATALPAESYAALEHGPGALPAPVAIDPNNPPWGLTAAVLTWIGSIALLIGMSLLIITPYILKYFKGGSKQDLEQFLLTDKTAVLLQILSAIPAHLLTLGLVWAVVTRFGKLPFWRALGWSWSKHFGFWTSAGLAVVLLVTGGILTTLVGGEKTQIDQIVSNSAAARYTLALLAATTGPLIEELVYRGVLYSAFQRTIGTIWTVVLVSTLFTFVHVFQYYNNLGVIAVISILSISLTLVRAYTGRLLPCFVMHMVFNGIQSVLIILDPYLPHSITGGEQKTEALVYLARSVHGLL